MVIVALLGVANPSQADDPLYGVAEAVNSLEVEITTYSVEPEGEASFIHALVQSGPYNGSESAFSNETISEALSDGTQPVEIFAVATFQNSAAADRVSSLRKAAAQSNLVKSAVSTRAKVVEHLLANWGWERGEAVKFTRIVPGQPTRVYDEYKTTLSFFKTGYTGQMSMVEFFRPGVKLAEVRSALSARRGMSGASIYREEPTGNYIAYSEYFDTASAQGASASALVADRRMGQVLQNYAAR
jgi:hypothetical protein